MKTYQVQFNIDEKAMVTLTEMQIRTGSACIGRVIAKAITVYKVLLAHEAEGNIPAVVIGDEVCRLVMPCDEISLNIH